MSEAHIITDPADVRAYMRGGNAKVTIKSLATGKHYTYSLKAPSVRTDAGGSTKDFDAAVRFVKVLHDGDQWSYIGAWYEGSPWLAAGRKGNAEHPAFKALDWVIGQANVRANKGEAMPENVEVWHEGCCGRCGRSLTDPVSIARGIGPECANKVGA
jgi:hypothetical protein